MEVRLHPNQDGYIITFPDGIEYATQEGDKYYEMADQLYHNPPIIEDTTEETEIV